MTEGTVTAVTKFMLMVSGKCQDGECTITFSGGPDDLNRAVRTIAELLEAGDDDAASVTTTATCIVPDEKHPKAAGRVCGGKKELKLTGNSWNIVRFLWEKRGAAQRVEAISKAIGTGDKSTRSILQRLISLLSAAGFRGFIINIPRKGYLIE